MNENEELTINEAAERKGVRVQTIHAAIRAGRLPARVDLPPGYARGRWMIRREDLDAWEPVRDPVQRGRRGGRPRKTDESEEGERSHGTKTEREEQWKAGARADDAPGGRIRALL